MCFFQDVRFGLRMMAKHPGFTLVAVVALALGIGVNTTVFTLVNAVLFKGLPFEDAHNIMYVTSNNLPRGRENIGVSYPDFRDWRAQAKSFKGLAGHAGVPMNVSDDVSVPERYRGSRVTANAFSLIGQKPVLGRDLTPEDEKPGAPAVVILGYAVWQDRYGKDPGVLGKTIRINEVPTVVIGIMPKGMKFPYNNDMWLALAPTSDWERRDARNMEVYGRLADGVTVPAARAELDLIARRLEKEYAKTNKDVGVVVKPFNDQANGGRIRVLFLAMLGAVGFVLLIACANVANLLLSRSLARTREISIRTALGASRWRVGRQMLVESVMLGLLGGALGLLIAVWGVRAFDLAVANVGKPYWIDFSMDFTVFAYLAAVCVLTGILFGLAPAIEASKLNLNTALKEGTRGAGGGRTKRLSGTLVVVELALAVVLLAGAGLMIRSFAKLYGMQTGFDAKRLLAMRVGLVDKKYPQPEDRVAFFERLGPRLNSIAGVEAAAITSNLPNGGSFGWRFEWEGMKVEEANQPSVSGLIVSPNYFQTVGVALVRGRVFDGSDGLPGKTAVIVNQRFAAKYWPGEDPLGKRLRLVREGAAQPWLTVVGVTPDIRQNDPAQAEIDPLIYVPYRQDPARNMAILSRTRLAPSTLFTAFRKEVQAVDQDLPVYAVMTLEDFFAQQRWPFRVFGTLFVIFAAIALALAAVGIYGVMAYAVSQRTQEIGVRMALGASAGNVALLVMASGVKQLAIGLAVGLAGAFGLTRVLKTLLVQISPTDPATFISITTVLAAAALAACWLPARRAMRVDPLVALRYE